MPYNSYQYVYIEGMTKAHVFFYFVVLILHDYHSESDNRISMNKVGCHNLLISNSHYSQLN
jgi:hypothetical protein